MASKKSIYLELNLTPEEAGQVCRLLASLENPSVAPEPAINTRSLKDPSFKPPPPGFSAWPVSEITDDGTTMEWRDSSGALYDPGLHAWSSKTGKPSVAPSGRFRAKRGAQKESHGTPETPPAVDTGEHSPTLKAMLSNVNAAEDAQALNRIESHPFANELSDEERQVLVDACRLRGQILNGTP